MSKPKHTPIRNLLREAIKSLAVSEITADEYQCALCKGVFKFVNDETWRDDKAQEESASLFGDIPPEQRAVICDDCFLKIHPARN